VREMPDFEQEFVKSDIDKVYSDYNVFKATDVDSALNFLREFKADLFLTDLTMPRSDKFARQVHRLAKLSTKVLEMDNRATEILAYCRKEWKYNAQYSIYPHQKLVGYSKMALLNFLNKITLERFGSKPRHLVHEFHSDIITVKGNWWKEQLDPFFRGSERKKIKVAGSLRYDYIKEISKNKIDYEKLGLDSKKETILICPTKESPEWGNTYYNKRLFSMVKIIDKNFDFNIVIKLHPNDILNSRSYKFDYFSDIDVSFCSVEDFYPLLRKSKLVISQFSSVGLESSIFKVPHLFFDSFTRKGRMDHLYLQEGMKIGHGFNKKNLCMTIEDVLNEDIKFNFNNYNKNVLNNVDGKSHLNISKQINNLLQK